jgi:hypothetical protein
LIYSWKLFCGNIFFFFFRSGVTVVNFALQTIPEEKVRRIKMGRTCWPNTTADNSVPEDVDKACIDIGAVWAVAESC